MLSLTKGIELNKYNTIRKTIGHAGDYYPINPFMSNLYNSFTNHTKHTLDIIKQDITKTNIEEPNKKDIDDKEEVVDKEEEVVLDKEEEVVQEKETGGDIDGNTTEINSPELKTMDETTIITTGQDILEDNDMIDMKLETTKLKGGGDKKLKMVHVDNLSVDKDKMMFQL